MRVSIIITNYNYGEFVAAAIDSALNQTHPEVEVIVVDDGSTDRSDQVIAGYAGRVHYLKRDHGGQMASTNAGFAHCRGDVVVLLDGDDWLYPHAVASHAAALADPAVAKSQGYLEVVDSSGNPGGGRVPVHLSSAGDYTAAFRARGPFAYQSAFTSGCAWRREVLEAVLPLPEGRAGFLGPDGYLAAVDALFGRIEVVEQPVGAYRVHGSNSGPIGYRFDAGYLREQVVGFEKRVEFAARFAHTAGLAVDVEQWMAHAGWKLTLSRHLLSLWGDEQRTVGLAQLCRSPFSVPERRLGLAAARALQLAAVRILPDRLALALARRILDQDWNKRMRSLQAPTSGHPVVQMAGLGDAAGNSGG